MMEERQEIESKRLGTNVIYKQSIIIVPAMILAFLHIPQVATTYQSSS